MRRKISVVAILLVSLAACAPSSLPTEQEARTFLDGVVASVDAGDINRLCELSDCMPDDRKSFQAPSDPPTIVATRVIQPASIPGGGESLGGQVLELCGIGPNSTPYHFEMLVFRANGQLHTPTYRYWQNMTVSGASSPTTAPLQPGAANCAAT